MDETQSATPAATFRARKKRKLVAHEPPAKDEDPTLADADAADALETAPSLASNVVRRFAAGRRGGGVSFHARSQSQSTEAKAATNADTNASHSQSHAPTDLITHDRFARATGKVGVVEDTHMTAYIDHKLAAIRGRAPSAAHTGSFESQNAVDRPHPSSSTSPPPRPLPPSLNSARTDDKSAGASHASTRPTHARNAQDDIEEVQLDALPSRQRHRDAGNHVDGRGTAGGDTTKRRRGAQQAIRAADAVARDALVDAIMREGTMSLYDTTMLAQSRMGATSSSRQGDNDAAVAEAFQAEFLAEMEERSLRRRPPPAPSGTGASGATNNTASSGPKLGGSRSMREKMRAAAKGPAASGATKK